jgi:hypothetical protein
LQNCLPWQANNDNLAKSAVNRGKDLSVFSGNAELGYSLGVKTKAETA